MNLLYVIISSAASSLSAGDFEGLLSRSDSKIHIEEEAEREDTQRKSSTTPNQRRESTLLVNLVGQLVKVSLS